MAGWSQPLGVVSRICATFRPCNFHQVLPRVGKIFSEQEAYTYLPKSVASFYTPAELRDSLTAKGFTTEKEINYLFGACRLVKAKLQ